MKLTPAESNTLKAQALKAMSDLDDTGRTSGRWWADHVGCHERLVWLWKNGTRAPTLNQAKGILETVRRVEQGELEPLPACRTKRVPTRSRSGYRGVQQHITGLWKASLSRGRSYYYPTPEHAALRYNILAKKAYGDCAVLNEVSLKMRRCELCDQLSIWVFRIRTRGSSREEWSGSLDACQQCIHSRYGRGGPKWCYDRAYYAQRRHGNGI